MARTRLFFLTLFAALLVACTAAPVAPAEPSTESTGEATVDTPAAVTGRDTFVYVRPQEIVSLDPAVITESQSGFVVRNVYSRLVDIAYDGSGVEPDLAESWEVSDDGLVYTFALRDGVAFHDGSPLLASDVVYSIQRLLGLGEGDASLLSGVLAPEAIEALDDQTVQFTLSEAFPAFLEVLGSPRGGSIVPRPG
ncbi:MAG: hypothetical protein HC802_20395 [Caldilineaceae bacterium]|nr:hypothetical protein [Caldilineaceae bacterium]